MKNLLLLTTLIISVTGSFALESNESIRAYRKLFSGSVPDGRIKLKADLFAEYTQGMPIVVYMSFFSVPAERKQLDEDCGIKISPFVLGQTSVWPESGPLKKDEAPTDTKVYISKAWKRNINFTLYNSKGASLGTTVSSLKQGDVDDDSVVALTHFGVFNNWIIEGDQTKDLQPGKYTLQVSLGPISETNSFLITENKNPQEAVLKVSNAWVSFLRGNYREAVDLAKDAMAQGGRMVNDKHNHAIAIMALSYERMGDYKESLRLWEEFKEKYVSDFPKGHRQPTFLHDLKIADLKKLIKNSAGQQGSTQK